MSNGVKTPPDPGRRQPTLSEAAAAEAAGRRAREAAALRQNLLRRKQQARARAERAPGQDGRKPDPA